MVLCLWSISFRSRITNKIEIVKLEIKDSGTNANSDHYRPADQSPVEISVNFSYTFAIKIEAYQKNLWYFWHLHSN